MHFTYSFGTFRFVANEKEKNRKYDNRKIDIEKVCEPNLYDPKKLKKQTFKTL